MMKFLLVLALVVLGVRVFFYNFEKRVMYYPLRHWEESPADLGLEFEDVSLKTSDGVVLDAWYLPHPRSAYTVLFLHGNAGNISHRLLTLALFHKLDLATLILDYRGYGKSEGSPSEKGFYEDARTAYEYLRNVKKIDPARIILFGESLGGAVAIELAMKVPVRAVICESTFSSTLDMGRHYFPYLPVRWLTSQKYDSLSKVRTLQVPKFFIQSPQDDIVPYPLGQRLFQAACQPKEFFGRSGDHNNYLTDPRIYEKIFQKIAEFH